MFLVVKQYDPFNKLWNSKSHYSKSGNFLGPAVFETEQEGQEYLEQCERKVSLASIDINSSNKSSDNNNGREGRRRGYQYIQLKVFQESTLPAIN